MYILIYLSVAGAPPFLFNQFSDALEWILQNNYGLQHVLHILDDFFITEPTRLKCLTSFSTLLRVFMGSRAPVVASKTLGPSQELEFMDIVLDSIVWKLAFQTINLTAPGKSSIPLPSDVLSAYLNCNLVVLVGTLQFACKGVVPGRTFLQKMINLTKGVPSRFHHI